MTGRLEDFRARTIIVHVEDRPGSLNRVVSLFRRRAYNIDSLTVARSEKKDVSRITLVVRANQGAATRIEAHLYKLIDVLHVEETNDESAVIRELCFIKLNTRSRNAVLELCEQYRGRIIDMDESCITVESTGTPEKLDQLIEALQPFEIVELCRTGSVAMIRGRGTAASIQNIQNVQNTQNSNPGIAGEA
jgi:acetolactate synthase-1/3 small subunit